MTGRRSRLLEVLSREGETSRLDRAVVDDAVTVNPREMLEVALERLQSEGHSMAPVLAEGTLVGLLTLENALEYLSFRRALGDRIKEGAPLSRTLFEEIGPTLTPSQRS